MIVLGIDPGTLHLGWGLARREGNRLVHLEHGVIDTNAKGPFAGRLVEIAEVLEEVTRRHSPDAASVESLFFAKDPQAAAKLGHARGVVLLTLARANVPIFEYPPARVKLTVAGSGQADKRQVGMMVRAVLGLPELPRADASDALALAITHLRVGDLAVRVEAQRERLQSMRRKALSAAKERAVSARARRPGT
jgi:crossover junction endodeoxyribonuclease RuvC